MKKKEEFRRHAECTRAQVDVFTDGKAGLSSKTRNRYGKDERQGRRLFHRKGKADRRRALEKKWAGRGPVVKASERGATVIRISPLPFQEEEGRHRLGRSGSQRKKRSSLRSCTSLWSVDRELQKKRIRQPEGQSPPENPSSGEEYWLEQEIVFEETILEWNGERKSIRGGLPVK